MTYEYVLTENPADCGSFEQLHFNPVISPGRPGSSNLKHGLWPKVVILGTLTVQISTIFPTIFFSKFS